MDFVFNNWAVAGAPFVIIGAVVLGWILNHRKQKSSTDHVLKL